MVVYVTPDFCQFEIVNCNPSFVIFPFSSFNVYRKLKVNEGGP
jgi:hypothetical protein